MVLEAHHKENMRKLLTSESVNIGHPDKTADTIADLFLDEALRQDPNAQMAVECVIKDDHLMIYGESTTTAIIDYEGIARNFLKSIGYTNEFRIIKQISEQSSEINSAVCKADLRANDQGIVYGFATNETSNFMPAPIVLAHRLMLTYNRFCDYNLGRYFRDAKSQVTVEYEDGKPIRIHTVLLSVSHSSSIGFDTIEKDMLFSVISPALENSEVLCDKDTIYIINPSGSFTKWGSFADSGCVGRKIVVDTYGGIGRVGGGGFSGKNPTKVDRSGAYYARYVAKNIIAAGLADKFEIQVAYGIGLLNPISINIDTFGTGKIPQEELLAVVEKNFDFSPANIIKELNLLTPIYSKTSCYGHFGWNDFLWERVNKADVLIASLVN